MSINVSPYDRGQDYERVCNFLIRTYGQRGYRNWFQPTWEYMHFHPLLDESRLPNCAVWCDGDEIVSLAHFEHAIGEVFFQIASDYCQLKEEMVSYAETRLFLQEGRKRSVGFYIDERDVDLEAIARNHGFRPSKKVRRDMTEFKIPDPFPAIEIAEGIEFSDLALNNDLEKVQRVLHRGFNHSGEPPANERQDYALIQTAPNYRKDLNVVARTSDGDFVSYCGIWFEPQNKFAYIEPVATDPDFRRLGLGRAVVLEAIRRCGQLGAKVAYVGSTQAFYRSMGFRDCQRAPMWFKTWD